MSTFIDQKTNKAYNISANRCYGGDELGLSVQFCINSGNEYHAILLSKKDAVDFCLKVIESLNELEKK
jgi:hypothetical protein